MADAQADGDGIRTLYSTDGGIHWRPNNPVPYHPGPWQPAPEPAIPYVPLPNTPYIPPITWPPLTPQPDVVLTTTTEPNMSRKAELVLLALVAMADRECRTVTIGFEDDESADVALKEGETFDEFVERVFHRLCNVRGRIPT